MRTPVHRRFNAWTCASEGFRNMTHIFAEDNRKKVQTNLYEAGVRHHLLGVDHVHQRLFDGHIANAAHVKPVNILPPWKYKNKTPYTCSAAVLVLMLWLQLPQVPDKHSAQKQVVEGTDF